MNPIERALANADKVIAAQNELERVTREAPYSLLRQQPAREARDASLREGQNLCSCDGTRFCPTCNGPGDDLPEGDEITDTRTDGEQDGWEAEARTYVIGLPVVVTVYPDGTVKAEVDLSEADDVFEASTPEGQDDSEEVLIADRETISNAVIQARVTVTA